MPALAALVAADVIGIGVGIRALVLQAVEPARKRRPAATAANIGPSNRSSTSTSTRGEVGAPGRADLVARLTKP